MATVDLYNYAPINKRTILQCSATQKFNNRQLIDFVISVN